MIDIATAEEAAEALREVSELEAKKLSYEWEECYEGRYIYLLELLETFYSDHADLFEDALEIIDNDLSVDFSEIAEGTCFDCGS